MLPALIFAADLGQRFKMLAAFPLNFTLYYASSVLVGWVAWYLALEVVGKMAGRSVIAARFLAGGMAALYVLCAGGAVAFFKHFGILPGVFAFDYAFEELKDSWIYAKSAVELKDVLGFGIVSLVLAAFMMKVGRKIAVHSRKPASLARAFFVLAALPYFHNNVRMAPNAFTPVIHSVFALTKAIEFRVSGNEQTQVVNAGARDKLTARLGPLPHNVLLILGESVRAQNLGFYGYERNTTPELSAFFARRAANMVRFDRAYANSTRTMMAFPSFFTGVVPAQSGALMHKMPHVLDYAATFDQVERFLISTQSLNWGNFADFIGTQNLGFAWYKENSAYASVDADKHESVDDKYLPEAFANFLNAKDPAHKFFGVVQFTSTHAPYLYDKASDMWKSGLATDDYDNSLHYNDRQISRVLTMLADKGLLDDTLIIATSDHGEAFGEHGYFGHLNTFYDEEARVPFWIHLPNALARRLDVVKTLRTNAQKAVSNADVIPTVMDLLVGKKSEAFAPQWTKLTGLPLSQSLPEDRAILLQNYNDIDEKTMFVGLGVVIGTSKYLLKLDGGRGIEELYDTAQDPLERHNIWPEVSPGLRQQIYAAIRQHKNSAKLFDKVFPGRWEELAAPEESDSRAAPEKTHEPAIMLDNAHQPAQTKLF